MQKINHFDWGRVDLIMGNIWHDRSISYEDEKFAGRVIMQTCQQNLHVITI
jgi:hypothetical protein